MELEEAYATLHNQRMREKYDRLGYDGEHESASLVYLHSTCCVLGRLGMCLT